MIELRNAMIARKVEHISLKTATTAWGMQRGCAANPLAEQAERAVRQDGVVLHNTHLAFGEKSGLFAGLG